MKWAESYQSIPAQISASEERQIAFEESVIDAYDAALEKAELEVRSKLLERFANLDATELNAIIDYQLAERRIRARELGGWDFPTPSSAGG